MNSEIWPNFFIVGAAKAGTSSLYAYLKRHPQIYMSPVKEPHFFSQIQPGSEHRYVLEAITNEKAYLDLFRAAGDIPVAGEASTTYLWDEQAPYRIHERVPEAKIIILLRDPIERAYSHYLMNVREGTQTLPFYEALLEDQTQPKSWTTSNLYVDLGLYASQVERYLKLFGPKRVEVLLSEDLKRDPFAAMRQAARFLKVDEKPFDGMEIAKPYNAYAIPRGGLTRKIYENYRIRGLARRIVPQRMRWEIRDQLILKSAEKPAMGEQAVEFLREVYAEDVEKLEDLLGRPLPELRRAWAVKTGKTLRSA